MNSNTGSHLTNVLHTETETLTHAISADLPSNLRNETHAISMKSHGGLGRLVGASGYTMSGLKAAWRNEAAFRQEVLVGVALMLTIPALSPSLVFSILMIGSVLLVWCIELVNSAIEALADAVSPNFHPLLGRAKDLGSAAVFFSLLIASIVWATALYVKLDL